jgi:hypothetical protein
MSGLRQYGALALQKGEAAEFRNDNSYAKTSGQYDALNQIVHSGDPNGKYAKTPNPYRDPTNTYDPDAQAVIEKVKSQKKKK